MICLFNKEYLIEAYAHTSGTIHTILIIAILYGIVKLWYKILERRIENK